MKKIIVTILTLMITVFAAPVAAQMDGSMMGSLTEDEHTEPIDEILEQLLLKYGAETVQELNCNELTENELEEIGDSAMGVMHPNPTVHAQMDAMMGGEGSESLREAHINMGRNYLGCNTYGSNVPMGYGSGRTAMMDYNRPGTTNSPLFDINGGNPGLNYLLSILFRLSLIAFLLTGTWFFIKKARSIK